jgi:hypothetical protein
MKADVMTLRSTVAAAFLVAAAVPTPTFAGSAACAVVDSLWRSGHSSAQSAIQAAVDDYSATVTAQNLLTYNQIMSAIRVMTSQQAATDHQIAATDLKANEANANAISANMTRLAVAKAYETYGDAGQPPDACDVAQQLSDLNQAIENSGSEANSFVSSEEIDVRPGGTPVLDTIIKARLSTASETTLDVAKSLLDPDASDAEVAAFVNNLTGLPLQKISVGGGGVAAQAGTAGAAVQNMLASRMEAYRSPALYSLGYIRAIRGNGSGAHAAASEGVSAHLDWIKARYGGGTEYEAWAAKMATKSEPGILKEVARIRSLAMAVRKLREESVSRMTVLVGGMVAQEASQR